MRKGEPASGTEFFDLLRTDDEFCAELGRAMLAAGRLESELKLFLAANGIRDTAKATLGQLTKFLERHGLLVRMQPHLDHLSRQRNYLAHSIHVEFPGFGGDMGMIGSTSSGESNVQAHERRAGPAGLPVH